MRYACKASSACAPLPLLCAGTVKHLLTVVYWAPFVCLADFSQLRRTLGDAGSPFCLASFSGLEIISVLTWGLVLCTSNSLFLCRIRLLYPSEWNSEFWRDKILKSKLKRTVLWERFASLLGSAQGDRSSVAQTLEPRIVNSLAIRVRNIHVHIVDDNLGATPWAFEVGQSHIGYMWWLAPRTLCCRGAPSRLHACFARFGMPLTPLPCRTCCSSLCSAAQPTDGGE